MRVFMHANALVLYICGSDGGVDGVEVGDGDGGGNGVTLSLRTLRVTYVMTI